MLKSDIFIKNIEHRIQDNNYNTLLFNFGRIINNNLFFHDFNNLEFYLKKIKQRDYKYTYKSYQKLTDGINDYIIYKKDKVANNSNNFINLIEVKGFQDVLHLKSSKDIKVVFKNLFQDKINEEEIPQSLDQVQEEVIEFEINQYIKLIIINQKYPKISEIKNDLSINLTLVENQDQNNSNLLEVYNLISYFFQE